MQATVCLLPQLNFGKHRGTHIDQVSYVYLQWMLKSFPQSSPWHAAAAEALAVGKTKQQRAVEQVTALLAELKSCSTKRDLQWGKGIHGRAVENGLDANMYVRTALIKMYAKSGSMVDARTVFDSIQKPDVVTWTALLLGYAENGEGRIALEMFSKMKTDGCRPNPVTYVALLKACTSLAVNGDGKLYCLQTGRSIHSEIGCHMDSYVQSALIDMYSKCGSMAEAHRVLDSMQKPDNVSMTALMLGYAEHGKGRIALDMFSRLKAVCVPDSVTYVAALKACTSLALNGDKADGLEMGRTIHMDIGCHLNLYVQSTLVDMYGKCGSVVDARRVFDSIANPSLSCWNALLLGYTENGQGQAALDLFSRMKRERKCTPDGVTYVAVLKACSSLAANGDGSEKARYLEMGKQIHSEAGDHADLYVQGTLIDMYAKCGSMVEARRVFDGIQNPDTVSCTAMFLGYAENGEGYTALDLFSKMACVPDAGTYIGVIKACTSLAVNGESTEVAHALEIGRNIHSEIDCHSDIHLQSTLIDMYGKCGSMVEARRVFDSIQEPNVVCWTALLSGYAENGEGHVALELFSTMKAHGCVPNSVTYVAIFKACGSMGALALGREFHLEIREFTPHIVTCLVDFYAKCGSMLEARAVYKLHSGSRDMSTWNALLAGYSSHGDTASVFDFFEAMRDAGQQPNAVSFLCVLSCCSHSGLVDKAREYLKAMPAAYGVTATVVHYNCVLDTLCRANQLNEAIALVHKMPCNPDTVIWMTLLGACRKRKNVEVGTLAFQSLLDLGTESSAAYVVMAHIYGSRGLWKEQENLLEAASDLTHKTSQLKNKMQKLHA